MYSTTDFRRGLKIEMDGEPYIIVEFQHVKPGKGGAFVRTRLKNLISGNVIDRTFKAGDKVERPDLEEKQMQYMYRDGEDFYFMDSGTYEQQFIKRELLQGADAFLQENIAVTVLFHKGRPITIELPNFVELLVRKTDPGVKGDTVSGGSKPAELETGAIIQVPLFIETGDRLCIDTRTGQYVERVK